MTSYLLLVAFAGATLMGLLLTPVWAARMQGPIRGLINRARLVADGGLVTDWPTGKIAELNRLSRDLERMSSTLLQREQIFRAIFEASPLPLSVVDLCDGAVLGEVNEAWLNTFGYAREDILGDRDWLSRFLESSEDHQRVSRAISAHPQAMPVRIRRADGAARDGVLWGRNVQVADNDLVIVATEDVTEQKRIDHELRELNTRLEQRVAQRTAELEQLNGELSSTLSHLQHTQDALIRAEKLAALGALVAGVAHELNTPLGNGLMSVSLIQDEMRDLRVAMQSPLRKSQLTRLVDKIDMASAIAVRNIHRAAELVTSFKQVAVDQTSAQRCRFELRELVDEIQLTLRPTTKAFLVAIDVRIAPDVVLDSYPGALGQVITNLVANALTHGFDGRDRGRISLEATPIGHERIRLDVSDDGVGIPADLIERIFDPFVTSRLGSGGTGRGLHISHNAVVNILGGEIDVHSDDGQGITFSMRLPLRAPDVSVSARKADGSQ